MAGKKELSIEKYENKHLYYVKFVQGGQLPKALQTDFTDPTEAQKWIDLYYAGAFENKSSA